MTDLLLTGIGHLTTNVGDPIERAAVSITDGEIVFAGAEADAPEQGTSEHLDCQGRAVIPGFVDAHTHILNDHESEGMSLDEAQVQEVVDTLLKKHLVSDRGGFSGSRVTKYRHRFCNTEFGAFKLDPQELAALLGIPR